MNLRGPGLSLTLLALACEGTVSTDDAGGSRPADARSASRDGGDIRDGDGADGGGATDDARAIRDAGESSDVLFTGATVIARGAGFGDRGPVVLLWEGFDEGAAGSALASDPSIGGWTIDPRPAPVHDRSVRHAGEGAARLDYGTSSDTWWGGILVEGLEYAPKFYQSFWWRHHAEDLDRDGVCKLTQWHGNADMGDFAPGWMHGSAAGGWLSYVSREEDSEPASWWDGDIDMNAPRVWRHFELLGRQSSAGNVADGWVRSRVDGEIMHEQSDVVTRNSSRYHWSETSFLHGGNVNGATDKTMFVDEVYLQSGWARVELGDAATYTASTLRVPQLVSAWSDGEVVYTVVPGALAPGPVWEFVIEDDDNVVSTRALTLE